MVRIVLGGALPVPIAHHPLPADTGDFVDKEKIYWAFPLPLQHLACSLQGLRIQKTRFGREFSRRLAEAEARTFWSGDRIADYRDFRTSEFLRYCQSHVPYYQKLFREGGIDAGKIRTLADLQALPVLEKSVVQEHGAEFQPEPLPRRPLPVHTSGTTGAGLHFYSTLGAQQEQWAVWWRYRRWHGIQPGTWCGYFGGRSIVPITQKQPPFWRYNLPMNQVMFSAHHLSPNNIPAYIDELRRRKPPWLHGYPSLLALIASWLLGKGESLNYVPGWITTGAENLLPQQAQIIRRAFGVSARQHYGMAEGVANISECDHGRLHVDEDFSATEFIDLQDGRFRVVGTNFTNPATALVRFATDDVVRIDNSPCSCGRPGRVVESMDGRKEDYVLLANGARVAAMNQLFKNLLTIREAQIVQFRPGELVFRVVRGPEYGNADEQALLREAGKRFGQDTNVKVEYVPAIERTRSGKLRLVISHCAAGRIEDPAIPGRGLAAAAGTDAHTPGNAIL